MAVKKNILITVFAIIILGLAIHPVLANDAAEEKAATVEKVTGTTETREAAEATVEEVSGQKAEPEKKEAESVH